MTECFKEKGDPVLDWKEDQLQFKIIGPLAGHAVEEGEQQLNAEMIQQRIIDDKKAPFQSYKVAQGSTIMVMGGPVMFASEKPPECMTIEYKKESLKTYNYYSCKTCGSNWICEACRKACHES